MKNIIITIISICVIGFFSQVSADTVLRYNSSQKNSVRTNSIHFYTNDTVEKTSNKDKKIGYNGKQLPCDPYLDDDCIVKPKKRRGGSNVNIFPCYRIPKPDFGGSNKQPSNPKYSRQPIHRGSSSRMIGANSFGNYGSSVGSGSFTFSAR